MYVHLLGICGTFMAGLAMLAKELGFRVTGCDDNVYPPVSTMLKERGISIIQGYEAGQVALSPDCYIVGNAMKRGLPIVEAILDQQLPFKSGPQWLYDTILRERWVLAVSGTHGKTTTSSMLAWILDYAGLKPGFLIGGIPNNFSQSARLGDSPFFVVEADEYDTAFFDKRSKFVHYHPRTLILNNLEYDHADIFPDVEAIKRQFHHLVRVVPRSGLLIQNASDVNIADVLKMGCWTEKTTFGERADWQQQLLQDDGSVFRVNHRGKTVGDVHWSLLGAHNRHNALAAIAAAQHAGVPANISVQALCEFNNVKRRLEIKACIHGVTVYDDFAHHPTAIAATVEGLRQKVGKDRIIAVLECGSYTMRSGIHQDTLAQSLACVDALFCLQPSSNHFDLQQALRSFTHEQRHHDNIHAIIQEVCEYVRPCDHVLVMSNTGFAGFHDKLIHALTLQGNREKQ